MLLKSDMPLAHVITERMKRGGRELDIRRASIGQEGRLTNFAKSLPET